MAKMKKEDIKLLFEETINNNLYDLETDKNKN